MLEDNINIQLQSVLDEQHSIYEELSSSIMDMDNNLRITLETF